MNQAPSTLLAPDNFLAHIKSIVQADHEIVSFSIDNFRRLFKGIRSPDASQDFAAIQRLIAEEIVQHFTHEEDNLFPALLTGNPTEETTQVIAELRQEHTLLLERARQLSALVGQRNLTNCTGQLWMAMMDFFNDLELHTAKEELLLESST
jgi:iron-sulfur cluster repair protein YtfE (RIC family)